MTEFICDPCVDGRHAECWHDDGIWMGYAGCGCEECQP